MNKARRYNVSETIYCEADIFSKGKNFLDESTYVVRKIGGEYEGIYVRDKKSSQRGIQYPGKDELDNWRPYNSAISERISLNARLYSVPRADSPRTPYSQNASLQCGDSSVGTLSVQERQTLNLLVAGSSPAGGVVFLARNKDLTP